MRPSLCWWICNLPGTGKPPGEMPLKPFWAVSYTRTQPKHLSRLPLGKEPNLADNPLYVCQGPTTGRRARHRRNTPSPKPKPSLTAAYLRGLQARPSLPAPRPQIAPFSGPGLTQVRLGPMMPPTKTAPAYHHALQDLSPLRPSCRGTSTRHPRSGYGAARGPAFGGGKLRGRGR